mgnify:CR=1 FL=1
MRIRITRATICQGQPVAVGAVVDVDDREGQYLVHIGKAEPAPATDTAPRSRRQRATIKAPERAVLE